MKLKLGTKSQVQPIVFSIHLKFDYTILEVKINCVRVNTVQSKLLFVKICLFIVQI